MWSGIIVILFFSGLFYFFNQILFPEYSEEDENSTQTQQDDVYVHRRSIGSNAELSYDGKVTRFKSDIVKFLVRQDRYMVRDDIQLSDQTATTVQNGNLHIRGKHFHIVVTFQNTNVNYNSNNANNTHKELCELRLYDDVNNVNIKKS